MCASDKKRVQNLSGFICSQMVQTMTKPCSHQRKMCFKTQNRNQKNLKNIQELDETWWIWIMHGTNKFLHFEWSPPWHHIITYLSQILTFFVLKSGEDEKERIILMKSRALRSLDFIRIILSSSSPLLVGGPAMTTVIYVAKLLQTDSRYAWFETISDAWASPDAYASPDA